MMLAEIFAPRDLLTPETRRLLTQRMLTDLTYFEEATPEVQSASRRLWDVVVHEPAAWATGGGEARFVVRISVPSTSMMNDEGRQSYVTKVTRVILECVDAEPEPSVSVHLTEIPEGNCGYRERLIREADLVRLVLGDGADASAAHPVVSGDTTGKDPVCGMAVDLTGSAITLEHDGSTYAFCCQGCRDVFAERVAA